MNNIVISREKLLEKIEDALSRQTFYDWYNNDYEEFIQGMEEAKTKEEILEDIGKLFKF